MDDQDAEISRAIRWALQEDIGSGDVTTLPILSSVGILTGRFVAKADGVIAGLAIVNQTFAHLDEQIHFVPRVKDGTAVMTGQIIGEVNGPGGAILSGERVALNFLQRMSGIATLTRQFVNAVQETSAIILDTRKTAPGLRVFDKWAVRWGGGENHRFGLYDMVLIKENHIAAAGSITAVVARVRSWLQTRSDSRPIEVEVQTLAELEETLTLSVDRIMLDNMSLAQMRAAIQITNGRIPLEASGNVNLDNVAAVAATGVNYISVGALTHSVKALDISLLLG